MPQTTPINVFAQVSDGTLSFASGNGVMVVEMSLAAYNALTTKDSNTLYVITS